jgi:hypothetical protein
LVAPKNGERDQRFKNIAFTVDNNSKCGRKCLQQLKIGEHNYELAGEVLGAARFTVHQQGLTSKANQKQNLKAAFNATIKVNLKYILLNI